MRRCACLHRRAGIGAKNCSKLPRNDVHLLGNHSNGLSNVSKTKSIVFNIFGNVSEMKRIVSETLRDVTKTMCDVTKPL